MSSASPTPCLPESRSDVMIVTPAWRYMTHTFPDGRPIRESIEEALQAFIAAIRTAWKDLMGEDGSVPSPQILPDAQSSTVPLELYGHTSSELSFSWSQTLYGTDYGAQKVREYVERLGGPEEVKSRMRAKLDAHKDGAAGPKDEPHPDSEKK